MKSRELVRLLDESRRIATSAGKAILAIASDSAEVETKSDGSPVTLADHTAHEIIITALTRLAPDIPIVSEEDPDPQVVEDKLYWLVDPLDGTKEFIKGLGEYTVNIALIEDDRPILGVIHAPVLDTLYFAARGLGAFKQENEGALVAIQAATQDRPFVAVASRSHFNPETKSFLDKLGVQETISRGSSLKICAIADGQADIYARLGPLRYWDTAAGTAIAREAGCVVRSLSGEDLSYPPGTDLLHPGLIVAPQSKPALMARLEELLSADL